MAGKRGSGCSSNQAARTKAAERRERCRRYAVAAAGISCPVAQVSNDLSRGCDSSHKRIRHGDDLGKMAVQNSLASDDLLDELIKQQQFIARLEKLLQQSNASVEKSTGLIVRSVCENEKLLNELDQKDREAARLKNLYEESHALVQKLSGEVGQLMDEKAEVLVKYKSLVEDSFAAVEESYEATKKEIEDVLAHQPIKNVAGV